VLLLQGLRVLRLRLGLLVPLPLAPVLLRPQLQGRLMPVWLRPGPSKPLGPLPVRLAQASWMPAGSLPVQLAQVSWMPAG